MRYPSIDKPLSGKTLKSPIELDQVELKHDKGQSDSNEMKCDTEVEIDSRKVQKSLEKTKDLACKAADWLTSTPCFVYCSHFLSAWGDRMWGFGVGLFLIQISPNSLQLTAIYGLSSGGAILVLAPLIGDWVDKNPRLKAARISLFLQNFNVIICAVLICLLVTYQSWAETLWDGWLLTLWHAGIIVFAVFANLASLGNKISVQRDWIVEICGRDKDQLATMGAVLRRIDLATKILAPIATGQVMTFAGMLIGAIVIAGWNFVSWFIEYFLLWKVYKSVPALANKKLKSDSKDGTDTKATDEKNEKEGDESADVPLTVFKTSEKQDGEEGPEDSNEPMKNENATDQTENAPEPANEITVEEESPSDKKSKCCQKGGTCYKMFGAFIILYNGWKTYMRNRVARAGIGLACLYLTVLGFDNITSAYAYSQGITESILGILMGSGALIGIIGTFAYTRIRRRVGLERTGLFSYSAQISCLVLCVVSIWVPGSPFDPLGQNQNSPVSVSACNQSTQALVSADPSLVNGSITTDQSNILIQNPVGFNQSDVTKVPICPDEPAHYYFSIALLMTGIITARFGLWISDLTVTQLMLENVIETERGVVNGVQSSLNQLMDMLKFALVVGVPHPPQFGYLVLISFVAVSTGGMFYASYSRKVRGHLFHPEKLKCISFQPAVDVDVESNGEAQPNKAPPAV